MGLRELHKRGLHGRPATYTTAELERRDLVDVVDRGVEYHFEVQLLRRTR
jgi:hypothetical protein